jgi:hypothetical protein
MKNILKANNFLGNRCRLHHRTWPVLLWSLILIFAWFAPFPGQGASQPWRVKVYGDKSIKSYGEPAYRGEDALLLRGWKAANGPPRQAIRSQFQRHFIPGKRVRVFYYGKPGDVLFLQQLEHMAKKGEQLISTLQKLWDWRVQSTFYFNIHIYADKNRFEEEHGVVALGFARIGALTLDHGELYFYADRKHPVACKELEATMLHEMFHALCNHCCRGSLPFCVDEGMAEWVSARLAHNKKKLLAERNQKARNMAKRFHINGSGRFIKTYMNCRNKNALRKIFGTSDVGYVLGEQLVDYFMSDPVRKLFFARMLRCSVNGADRQAKFAQLMEANYPGGLSQLERDWHAWMELKFKQIVNEPLVAVHGHRNHAACQCSGIWARFRRTSNIGQ